MRCKLIAVNAQYMHVNLAVRTVRAAVGDRAEIYEGHINLPFHDLLEAIAREPADAYIFSCYIWNIDLMARLWRALGRAQKAARIYLAGPEVESDAEGWLAREECVSGVLRGEGERTVPNLLDALEQSQKMTQQNGEGFSFAARSRSADVLEVRRAESDIAACEKTSRDVAGISGIAPETNDLSRVPGLVWREGARVCANPPAAPLDPAQWPDVWRDGVAGLESRILYIETVRGCPYRCRYCLSAGAGPVRALDAEEAIRRLTDLSHRGAKLVKLVDRTFNFDRTRALAIWRGLIEDARAHPTQITYHFEIGAHLLDARAIALLRTAPKGLFQFEAGIQSTDEATLRQAGRAIGFDALRETLACVAQMDNIHLHVDLIAGLPGESLQTFARSFDDALRLGAEQLQLGFLKVLPGCAFRRDADALGLVYAPDAPYEVLATREISFAELCFLKDVERVLNAYVNSGRYPLSIRYLIGDASPFSVLSDIARFCRAKGLLDRALSEKGRAEALLSYRPDPRLSALVLHDFLSQSRRRELPESLAFQENDREKALLRARFSPVRGQSAYRYPYDVTAFAREKALPERETLLVYDANGEWIISPT